MGRSTHGVAADIADDERIFLRAAGHPPALSGDAGARAVSLPQTPSRPRSVGFPMAALRQAFALESDTGTAFLFVPVLFGAGILAYAHLRVEPQPALLAGIALAWVAVAWATARLVNFALPVALAGLIVSAGMVSAKLETWRAGTQMLGAPVTTQLAGFVREIENRANGRVRLTIDLTATERPKLRYQPQRIRATLRSPVDFRAGDLVEGRVRLLPHGGPVLPGGYDFAFHGYYNGIGANGFVFGKLQRSTLQPPRSAAGQLHDAIHNLRHAVAERITRVAGEGDAGAIAAALVSGMTDPISEESAEVLRRTGLAHILSISGLHMALVAGIFLAGLRALAALFPGFSSRHPVRKYAAAGALAGAFAYLHLAGGSVATQRSFVMLAVMLLALLFDRAALTMRNLAIAAMVVLLVSPHEIAGPSFQMSFAATAALIAVYGAITRWREARPHRAWQGGPLRRGARMIILGTGALALTALIGGSATALYAAHHFHAVAPFGLITNVLAMPVVSFVVMPAGVLGMLAMPLGLDAPLFAVMGWGAALVLDIANWVDTLSGPGITGIVPGWALAAFSAALCVALLARTALRYLSVLPLILGVALLAGRDTPRILVSEDARTVGVRSGDGLLITRPRGNAFALGIWSRALGGLDVVPPGDETRPGGTFACEGGVCVLDAPGLPIVVHIRADGRQVPNDPAAIAGHWCGRAELIVIADATVAPECGAANTLVIGARELALTGAAAIHLPATAPEGTQGSDVLPGAARVIFAYTLIERPWNDQRRFSRAARGLAERR